MKRTQRNGKIDFVHGSEKLVLIKYPCYVKWSAGKHNLYQNSNIIHRNRKHILKFAWDHKF